MNVVLCGMMGCGKSCVSREMGRLYGYEVIDTDAEIEKKYGKISDIFAARGEEYFRGLEAQVIKEVSAKDGVVIATGGGSVLRKENVERLKACGKIIYLKTDESTIISRLENDNERPLLQGGVKEKVHSILLAREPVYAAVADIAVKTDGRTAEEIAKLIRELIK